MILKSNYKLATHFDRVWGRLYFFYDCSQSHNCVRYDFKEAEAVARKFAALEETAKNKTKKEKDHDRETDVTSDNKTNGPSVDDADSKQAPSTSGDSQGKKLINKEVNKAEN